MTLQEKVIVVPEPPLSQRQEVLQDKVYNSRYLLEGYYTSRAQPTQPEADWPTLSRWSGVHISRPTLPPSERI